MRWCSMATWSRRSALGFTVGRGGRIPSRRVGETDLPEGGNQKGPTDRNQKIKAKYKTSMKQPTITAYLKPACGWSQGVRAMLRKYSLPCEDRDSHGDAM